MKSLDDIFKEFSGNFKKAIKAGEFSYEDYGCDGASEECCGSCGGEMFSETSTEEWFFVLPRFWLKVLTGRYVFGIKM